MIDRRIGEVGRDHDGEPVVYCACGATMAPEVGRNLELGVSFLFWRCVVNARHATRSIPLPGSFALLVGVGVHEGEDE